MAKHSKRFTKLVATVEANKLHTLAEAVSLVKANATTKFNETVEVAVNLGVDPRQSDQQVRGMVPMPHGIGKTIRVAVFARGDKAEEAKKAGADIVGSDDLAEMIQRGEMNFDRVIATPDMMVTVGKLGKVLGPKGLMPNPKLGTVTPNVAEAVKKAKAGEVEFRVEKAGIVHAGIGRVSFTEAQITDNIKALIDALTKAKPTGSKGTYMKRVSISSSMGAGIKIDINSLKEAA